MHLLSWVCWQRRLSGLVRAPIISCSSNFGLRQAKRDLNISSDSSTPMKVEVSKFLISLLRSNSEDEQVVAAQTLSNFSYDPHWRAAIVRAGAVSPLLKLATHTSVGVKGDSAICLSHLSWHFCPDLVGTHAKINTPKWNSSVFPDALQEVFVISDTMCPPIIDAILGILKDPFASRKIMSTLEKSNVHQYGESDNDETHIDSRLLRQLPRHEYVNDKHRLVAALNSLMSVIHHSPSQCEYILSQGSIPTLLSLTEHEGQHEDDVAIRNSALSMIASLVNVPGFLVYVDHSHIFWIIAAVSQLLKPPGFLSDVPASTIDTSIPSTGYIYPSPPTDNSEDNADAGAKDISHCFSHTQMLAVHVLQGMCRFAEARPLIVHAGALMHVVAMYDTIEHTRTVAAMHRTHDNQLLPSNNNPGNVELISFLQLVYSLAECSSFSRILFSAKGGKRFDIVRGALRNGSLVAKVSIIGELLYLLDSLDTVVEDTDRSYDFSSANNIPKSTTITRANTSHSDQQAETEDDCGSDDGGVYGLGVGGGESSVTSLLDGPSSSKHLSKEQMKAELVNKLIDEQWLPPLIDALHDGSVVCVQYTTGVLCHFAESVPMTQKMIVDAGILPRVLALLVRPCDGGGNGSCAENIQTHTSRLVCSLTQNNSLHEAIYKHGGAQNLASVMQNEFLCDEARKFSALGLANLANGPRVKGKEEMPDATLHCLEAYLDEDLFKWM